MTDEMSIEPVRRTPVRRKVVQGVEHFWCKRCETWKPRIEMVPTSPSQASGWGVHGECRVCRNHRERTRYTDNKRRLARERAKRHKFNDKLADIDYKGWLRGQWDRLMVDPEALRPVITELVERAGGTRQLEEELHLGEDVIRKMFTGRNGNERMWITVEKAERILIAAGMEHRLDDVIPVSGMDGWNKAGDRCCQDCGTFYHKHQAKGLCRLCYHRRYYNDDAVLGVRDPWSYRHERCIDCGTDERKHYGNGRCRQCHDAKVKGLPPVNQRIKQCADCGKVFNKQDPRATYCSGTCKNRAHRKRKRDQPR